MKTVRDFTFLHSKITADGDCSHEIKKPLLLGRKAVMNPDSILQSRDITLPISLSSQSYGFSTSYVWMWELDDKESWVPKNWCFWTVVLEKTLESPLDSKEIKPVNPKGNQTWIFIGRTDAEAPILWPPDGKSQLIGKDPNSGEVWRQKEKRAAEMRWLDSITDSMNMNLSKLGDGEGQGSLACCSPWGFKESDTTYWLNNSNVTQNIIFSPWGGTKDPWLCLVVKIFLFCHVWLFPFVSRFSHLSD